MFLRTMTRHLLSGEMRYFESCSVMNSAGFIGFIINCWREKEKFFHPFSQFSWCECFVVKMAMS